MEITLDQLCLGQKAVVNQINIYPRMVGRLRDFGLIPGTHVRCRYRSPGGAVMAIELRGSVLALRTCDLEKIWGVCE